MPCPQQQQQRCASPAAQDAQPSGSNAAATKRDLAQDIARSIAESMAHWARGQPPGHCLPSDGAEGQATQGSMVAQVVAAASAAAMAAATAVISAAGEAVQARLHERAANGSLPYLAQPLAGLMQPAPEQQQHLQQQFEPQQQLALDLNQLGLGHLLPPSSMMVQQQPSAAAAAMPPAHMPTPGGASPIYGQMESTRARGAQAAAATGTAAAAAQAGAEPAPQAAGAHATAAQACGGSDGAAVPPRERSNQGSGDGLGGSGDASGSGGSGSARFQLGSCMASNQQRQGSGAGVYGCAVGTDGRCASAWASGAGASGVPAKGGWLGPHDWTSSGKSMEAGRPPGMQEGSTQPNNRSGGCFRLQHSHGAVWWVFQHATRSWGWG